MPADTFADYQRIDAVNASSLKVLWQKSPLHYQWALTHPRTETDSMKLGTLVHRMILEPDKGLSGYVSRPACYPDYRSKEARDWRDAQTEAGVTVITQSEYEDMTGMVASVLRHRVARDLLENVETEQTIAWTDAETGIKCKGRLDFMKRFQFGDLKKCRDIREKQFTRQVLDLGYHFSAAFYWDGMAALGMDPQDAHWICVEGTAPYDVAVYRINDDWLELGRDEYRPALQALAQCRLTGRYDGIAPNAVDLELPPWAYPKIVDDDSTGFEIVEDEDDE